MNHPVPIVVITIDLLLLPTRSTNEKLTFLNLRTNALETSVRIDYLLILKCYL